MYGGFQHFTSDDVARHAEMCANRVRKNFKKYAKHFEQQAIGSFRLYDRDIPEVRVVVDWYEGHLVVGEYVRQQTEGLNYVWEVAEAVANALNVPSEQLHVRERRTRPSGGPRYERQGRLGDRVVVREREMRFWVNLDDYLDTGLFSDHRDTRRWVADRSSEQRFLNLFSYTGTFSCYAAAAGAHTTTVDLSGRYLDWARDNFLLNEIDPKPHAFVRLDVAQFVQEAQRRGRTYSLIFVDPPSFSTRFGSGDFDVQRDHVALLRLVSTLAAPGATLLFSTNHQEFRPCLEGLDARSIEELTVETVPREYRNRQVHRTFCIAL